MTAKTEQRVKNWLGIIGEAITIIIIVTGLLYVPVKAQFKVIEARLDLMEKTHEQYYIEQEKKHNKYASVDIMNIRLDNICKELHRLFQEIDKCQQEDREVRNELKELIKKLTIVTQ